MRTYFDEKLNDYVDHVSDMITVEKVVPLENYKLLLTFSNGERKIFDMKSLLSDKMYSHLRSYNLFNKARAECGTVVWNEEVDLCPEILYKDSVTSAIS